MRRPQWTRVFVQSAFCMSNSLFSFSQVPLIDSLINKEQIRATIEFLASDALKGRLTGSPEMLKAANFIAEEFRKAGTKTLDTSREYLVYGLIERVTRAIALAIMPIVNGEVTPKRINAAKYSNSNLPQD